MNRNRWAALAVVGLGLVTSAGCGGDTKGEVTGAVTAKGQPLQAGVVTFFPAAGGSTTPVAVHVTGGVYNTPALPFGDYRITVTPVVEPPQVTVSASGQPVKPGQADPSGRNSAPAPPPKSPIAGKYGSVDTSGLSCKIDKSKVDHPIVLD